MTRQWRDIPLEVLRDFVEAKAHDHTYAGLEAAWGVGHETLRKFVLGATGNPHPRTLQVYGDKYLEHHPSGYVEERVDGRPRGLRELKMVLPPGRTRASEIIDRVFDLAARHPGEAPEETERIREWLHSLLDAEYAAEVQYPSRRRRPR